MNENSKISNLHFKENLTFNNIKTCIYIIKDILKVILKCIINNIM